MFIGRKEELKVLEKHYASAKAELLVLYGRRRVGKTELLRQFYKDKPTIYYSAAETEGQDNLDQFVIRCQEFYQGRLNENISFKTIEGILEQLIEQANKNKAQKLIVVLDEFQYWVNADQAIPSLIQRFWDHKGQYSNLMLILCGSSISLMVDYALAEKSPLYGRRTGQLHLKPFDFRTAGKFFPDWTVKNKLLAYGVLGGIPAYLKQFDQTLNFKDNLIQQVLNKDTFLYEEAEFLLKTELRDTKTYNRLLKAIAGGNTTLKDLTSKLGHTATSLSSYLSNLQMLQIIVREISLLEKAPEKSKKGRYYLQDNFLNFWFRFVEPNKTLVELNEGNSLYQQKIEPLLADYMGSIFEQVCKQYLLYYGREAGLLLPQRVGRVWDKDFDIDVVSENIDGSYTFGECKWSTKLTDTSLYYQLRQRAEQAWQHQIRFHYILFSLAGFKQNSVKPENLKTITGNELFDKD